MGSEYEEDSVINLAALELFSRRLLSRDGDFRTSF